MFNPKDMNDHVSIAKAVIDSVVAGSVHLEMEKEKGSDFKLSSIAYVIDVTAMNVYVVPNASRKYTLDELKSDSNSICMSLDYMTKSMEKLGKPLPVSKMPGNPLEMMALVSYSSGNSEVFIPDIRTMLDGILSNLGIDPRKVKLDSIAEENNFASSEEIASHINSSFSQIDDQTFCCITTTGSQLVYGYIVPTKCRSALINFVESQNEPSLNIGLVQPWLRSNNVPYVVVRNSTPEEKKFTDGLIVQMLNEVMNKTGDDFDDDFENSIEDAVLLSLFVNFHRDGRVTYTDNCYVNAYLKQKSITDSKTAYFKTTPEDLLGVCDVLGINSDTMAVIRQLDNGLLEYYVTKAMHPSDYADEITSSEVHCQFSKSNILSSDNPHHAFITDLIINARGTNESDGVTIIPGDMVDCAKSGDPILIAFIDFNTFDKVGELNVVEHTGQLDLVEDGEPEVSKELFAVTPEAIENTIIVLGMDLKDTSLIRRGDDGDIYWLTFPDSDENICSELEKMNEMGSVDAFFQTKSTGCIRSDDTNDDVYHFLNVVIDHCSYGSKGLVRLKGNILENLKATGRLDAAFITDSDILKPIPVHTDPEQKSSNPTPEELINSILSQK